MTIREVAEALSVDPGCVVAVPVALDLPLHEDTHSWAGSRGTVGYLFRDGAAIRLAAGGWYSVNGTLTRDDPPIPLAVALQRVGAVDGDLVAVRSWCAYDGDREPETVTVHRLTAKDAALVAAAQDPAEAVV